MQGGALITNSVWLGQSREADASDWTFDSTHGAVYGPLTPALIASFASISVSDATRVRLVHFRRCDLGVVSDTCMQDGYDTATRRPFLCQYGEAAGGANFFISRADHFATSASYALFAEDVTFVERFSEIVYVGAGSPCRCVDPPPMNMYE